MEEKRRAALTVFGGFIALFCTFGQMNSFGTFHSYYLRHQLQHLTPSKISWIGSLQLWVFFFSVSPSVSTARLLQEWCCRHGLGASAIDLAWPLSAHV